MSKVIQKWHVLMLTLTKIFQNHHCKNICSHLILVLQRFIRIFQHLNCIYQISITSGIWKKKNKNNFDSIYHFQQKLLFKFSHYFFWITSNGANLCLAPAPRYLVHFIECFVCSSVFICLWSLLLKVNLLVYVTKSRNCF